MSIKERRNNFSSNFFSKKIVPPFLAKVFQKHISLVLGPIHTLRIIQFFSVFSKAQCLLSRILSLNCLTGDSDFSHISPKLFIHSLHKYLLTAYYMSSVVQCKVSSYKIPLSKRSHPDKVIIFKQSYFSSKCYPLTISPGLLLL